jgi:hypothetical protein
MSYVRRPHPTLPDYDVVTFETKVRHELLVRRDVSEDDLVQLIVGYLLQYESTYPDTEDVNMWISLLKKLPSPPGEGGEVLT